MAVCAKCQKEIPQDQVNAGKIFKTKSNKYICFPCGQAIKQQMAAQKTQQPVPEAPPPAPKIPTAPKKMGTGKFKKPAGIKRPLKGKTGSFKRPMSKKIAPRKSRLAQEPQGDEEEGEVAEKKSSKKYIIGAAAGVLVVVIVGIMLFSGGGEEKSKGKKKKKKKRTTSSTVDKDSTKDKTKPSDSDKPSKEDKLAEAKKAYEEIIEYADENPLESDKIISKIEDSYKIVAKTEYADKLKEIGGEHNKKSPIIQEVKEYAASFEKSQSDFQYYLEEFNNLKEKAEGTDNNDALLEFIDKQIEAVNKLKNAEVDDALETMLASAQNFMDEHLYEEARAECNAFPESLKNEKVEEEIEKLMAKIDTAEEEYRKYQKEAWHVIFGGENTDTTEWVIVGVPPKMEVKKDDKTLVIENKSSQPSYIFFGDASWEDCTLELEYKVTQGAFTILLRFDYELLQQGQIPQQPIDIPFKRKPGDDSWKKLNVKLEDMDLIIKEGDKPENKKTLPENAPENGAFGITLNPGDRVIIKSIKVQGVDWEE